jgi:RNA polymerase sigma-70 factor (ECF subfamily)
MSIDPTRPVAQSESGPPDLDLLRRCAAGESAAMRLLFERHQRPLTEYLYRMLEDREDAEEAVGDVFVKAWRGAAGFQGGASVRNWLYRIAMNVAIDRLRRRRRSPVGLTSFSALGERDARLIDESDDGPEAALLAAYQRAHDDAALRHALQRLAPQDRAILSLHYFEGCSYEQICEITGQSLGRVKSRLYRARKRLKDHFVTLRESDELLEPLEESLDPPPTESRRLFAI